MAISYDIIPILATATMAISYDILPILVMLFWFAFACAWAWFVLLESPLWFWFSILSAKSRTKFGMIHRVSVAVCVCVFFTVVCLLDAVISPHPFCACGRK